MRLKNIGIYGCILYGCCYLFSAFSELSSASNNYASMTETVQMAAEMSVQQGLSGAEYDYGVLFNESDLSRAESELLSKGYVSGNIDIMLKNTIDSVEQYYNAGRCISVAQNTYDTSEDSTELLFNSILDSPDVLQTEDVSVSFLTHLKGIVPDMSDKTFADDIDIGFSKRIYNQKLYDKMYTDNLDWKHIVNISNCISTNIPIPTYSFDVINQEFHVTNDCSYMRPTLFSMGYNSLCSYNGYAVLLQRPTHTGILNLSSDIWTSAYSASNLSTLLPKYLATGPVTPNLKQLCDNYIKNTFDLSKVNTTYQGGFSESTVEIYDSLNNPTGVLLNYYTIVTPLNCGVTYFDRKILQQLFIDNMSKLMLGSEIHVNNLGYVYDENGSNLKTYCDELRSNSESFENLPANMQRRLQECFYFNIINNGRFNFTKGVHEANGFIGYYISSPENIGHPGDYIENLPTVEYKVIDACDSANDAILHMIYKNDVAIENVRNTSEKYDDGTRHKYIVVAKITFFTDVSLSYSNIFARDAVYASSHHWIASDSGNTLFGVNFDYNENDANTDDSVIVYPDQASIRNLHRFNLTETTNAINNVRYNVLTGNVMYEYTTYATVLN